MDQFLLHIFQLKFQELDIYFLFYHLFIEIVNVSS